MDIDGNGRVGRGDLKTMLQGAEPVEVPLIPVNVGASCSPELRRHTSVSLSRAVDQTGTAQVVSTDETVDVAERHDGSAAAGEHEESSHVGGIPRSGIPSKDGPNPRGLYPPGLENQMGERVALDPPGDVAVGVRAIAILAAAIPTPPQPAGE
eukprot:scaffold243996_cov40-Tisochrysis_lutea.AAC.2